MSEEPMENKGEEINPIDEVTKMTNPINEVTQDDFERAGMVWDSFDTESDSEDMITKIALALSAQRREIEAEAEKLAEGLREWKRVGMENPNAVYYIDGKLSHWEAFKMGR